MEIFDGEYYKSCKTCLEAVGLWPYQSSWRRRISELIFFLINATLAVPQFILLAKVRTSNFNITVENSVSVMFTIGCCAKYIVSFESSKRLQLLFEQIAKDWQNITDDTERSILTKYTKEGRFLVVFYTWYIFIAWIIYTLMPFTPFFMDILFPLNESRTLLLPYYADYVFFDQADFHYGSCFHISIVYISCGMLFCGLDTTFVITVKHVCGLFGIICHRLEGIKPKKESEYAEQAEKTLSPEELRKIVVFHNDSIVCSGLLEDSFNMSFLIVSCLSVLGLALCAVYLLFIFHDFFKFIRVLAFFCGLIIHLLYLNWVGQQIIDSSGQVFISAYCCHWYLISIRARSFIKIIMVRSLDPCRLTAGKLSTLCMESFGNLMQTTMSYFTVFLSVT